MPSCTPTPGQPRRRARIVAMKRQPRSRRSPADQPPMRPCAACGWDVLVATAEKTGGYCFSCQWLTTGEACSILRLKRDILYALADTGKLTRLKITARTHRWLRIDIDHLRTGRTPIMQSYVSAYRRDERDALSCPPIGANGAQSGHRAAA